MSAPPPDPLEIRVRPAPRAPEAVAEQAPDGPRVSVQRRARDRVREALVCPYCRDQVVRDDVIACASRSCGALYHRECWEHCQTEYGSCAALGCGSTALREISAAGYVYRILRLFVAAILFPPRALRAWRATPRDSSVYRDAHERARQGLTAFVDHPAGLLLVVVALVVLSYAMVGGILYGAYRLKGTSVLTSWVIFSVFFFTPLLVPVLSYVLTYQLVLGFHLARAALAGEFAALDRADRGPMSYLARIAASVAQGKPKG
ncbi:MAG: hypothetical protein KDD82_19360 [Planctomycetes bacterium]|nr:hypothetical protein [Planctomycetota bacterium]